MYRKQKCSDRLYHVTVDRAHLTVWFDEDGGDGGAALAEVLRVQPASRVTEKCKNNA